MQRYIEACPYITDYISIRDIFILFLGIIIGFFMNNYTISMKHKYEGGSENILDEINRVTQSPLVLS